MLTVLEPATATRLTTVPTVRARYGITDGDATNAVIEGLIDTASQMAVDFCNRTFGRETVRQTNHAGGGSRILLERSPAIITEVRESGEVLPSDGYYLETSLNVLVRLSGDVITCWGGKVETTYHAGWVLPGHEGANLPATVEHAVLLLIGAIWSAQQRDPGVKSESVDGISRTDYWMPGAANRLPDPTAEILLQTYRRYF